MNYRDYRVFCFKEVDYIATRKREIEEIMNFYRSMFEDDLVISEVVEIKDRDKEFILINEETNYKERTTYNKLIEEYIIITDGEDYLYLCSSEH
jgi:hypothetical protein